jgi:outer membrane protein TolC
LASALENNPAIEHAKLAIEVADINIRVAHNQALPRLDLTGSARTQGLARERPAAGSDMWSGDHASYAVGLSFEYPLGDRGQYAELLKRRLERRRALSTLHNIADQVATQVKERIRKVETNLAEIKIQREAAVAARTYLQALEDSEVVRQQLTAEFLLVKLQAQEILATAERSEIGATVDFNIAVAELAQISGTVLGLHPVEIALPKVPEPEPDVSEVEIEGSIDQANDDHSLDANPSVSSSQ